jgi:hypothetical protein
MLAHNLTLLVRSCIFGVGWHEEADFTARRGQGRDGGKDNKDLKRIIRQLAQKSMAQETSGFKPQGGKWMFRDLKSGEEEDGAGEGGGERQAKCQTSTQNRLKVWRLLI